MRTIAPARDRIAVALLLFASLAGCGAPVPTSTRASSSQTISFHLPDNGGRGVSTARRFTDSHGNGIPGYKFQAAQRTYWLPHTARITKSGPDLLVFAYESLLVFPRSGVQIVDNISSAVQDREAYEEEANPAALALRDRAKNHAKKAASSRTRAAQYVNQNLQNQQLGNCDVWDPTCICPDCSGTSSPWDEQAPQSFDDFFTPDFTYPDPSEECMALSGDDPTSYSACMAAGGPGGIRGFGNFFRSNTRAFDFYTGNDVVAMSTVDNPIRRGANFVNMFYNGLIDNPSEESDPLQIGQLWNADFVNYALYGTHSGVFCQMQLTWIAEYGYAPVEVSAARIAAIKFASWINGMRSS